MFEYDFKSKARQMFVVLPDCLCFDTDFLDSMTDFIKRVSDNSCKEVYISCSPNAQYDKMSKAYLLNVLFSFLPKKEVKWNTSLSNIISTKIHVRDGSCFEKVDMVKICADDNLNYYVFKDKETVSKPVGEMVKILVEKNAILNADGAKEFLSTTIGEIFSNCFLHSNQDEAFFMFDIVYENKDFFLVVNIIDYGTTLISNVKKYFLVNKNQRISSVDCFMWAIKEGTTTRAGSGGYGLATLIDYVSKAKGELSIFSGDAFYFLKNQERYVRTSLGVFNGTSVTFKVKLYESNQIMSFDLSNKRLVTVGLDDI